MKLKFHEGQQVWVCADIGGQLVREKGIILSMDERGVTVRSFTTSPKNAAEFCLGADGRGDNVWLEPRL